MRLSEFLSSFLYSSPAYELSNRLHPSYVSVGLRFQPKNSAPIAKPSSILVRRDLPLQITRFPGEESPARARWPPSRASFVRYVESETLSGCLVPLFFTN